MSQPQARLSLPAYPLPRLLSNQVLHLVLLSLSSMLHRLPLLCRSSQLPSPVLRIALPTPPTPTAQANILLHQRYQLPRSTVPPVPSSLLFRQHPHFLLNRLLRPQNYFPRLALFTLFTPVRQPNFLLNQQVQRQSHTACPTLSLPLFFMLLQP